MNDLSHSSHGYSTFTFKKVVFINKPLKSVRSLTISEITASDVDPDPVGSAFSWVHGFGSRCIKQRLTKKIYGFFSLEIIFHKSEPKK